MNTVVSFIFMLCLLVLVTLNEAKPRYKSGRMGRFQFPFSEESEESKESTEEGLCTQNCKITNIGNGYKNRNEFHCEIATTPVKARLSVAAYLENKYDKIIQWMKAWSAHEQDTTLSCCRSLHVKHAAYASALYTLNISILVVLLYSWRIGVNAKRFKELDDVYYGVQIAYFAIIGTQMFMIVLSIFLFYGIYKENVAFLVPWVVGCMTFMALEAMAMVYSNILRDHVNKQFDAICKAEVLFLIPRVLLNCLCIWCVLRLYHLLRAGITWKGSAAIEL